HVAADGGARVDHHPPHRALDHPAARRVGSRARLNRHETFVPPTPDRNDPPLRWAAWSRPPGSGVRSGPRTGASGEVAPCPPSAPRRSWTTRAAPPAERGSTSVSRASPTWRPSRACAPGSSGRDASCTERGSATVATKLLRGQEPAKGRAG